MQNVFDQGQSDQREHYCLCYLWADGPVERYHRCLGDWSAAEAEQERRLEFPLYLTAFKSTYRCRHCLCQSLQYLQDRALSMHVFRGVLLPCVDFSWFSKLQNHLLPKGNVVVAWHETFQSTRPWQLCVLGLPTWVSSLWMLICIGIFRTDHSVFS